MQNTNMNTLIEPIADTPNIALIGGGSGSFTLLQELKTFTPNISAIVNMCDDGGSTGRLRDELGVLPPGDVRQCLVALSDTPEVRDLFSYRFGEGSFAGHSLGNIILSALELQQGSFDKAVKVVSSILHITGRVIPVTLDEHTLIMEDGDETVRGEYKIGHRPILTAEPSLYLDPGAEVNPDARQAILEADLVAIAPGNLFGSLLPALLVNGVCGAMQETQAKKVVISNLVTKPGQTDNWHVVDYVRKFEEYLGDQEIDFVVYNSEPPSADLLENYANDGEFPVGTAEGRFGEIYAQAIGVPLIAGQIDAQNKHDKAIKRTLIRHDARQVGNQLMQILSE
jgi:uncharacterized cofD-like protein